MINIDDLTIGQVKEISKMIGSNRETEKMNNNEISKAINDSQLAGLSEMIGKKVIIRTYSAGCWFGLLDQKAGNEVILKNARRMWYWHAENGISLSACALYGVKHKESKIVEPVESVWLEAIEIIPCTEVAIESLEGAPNVEAK